jgi:hypothetical protein
MSDRVSKKVCLDGNLFIEVYIDKRSYFVIVYVFLSASRRTLVANAANNFGTFVLPGACTRNILQSSYYDHHE